MTENPGAQYGVIAKARTRLESIFDAAKAIGLGNQRVAAKRVPVCWVKRGDPAKAPTFMRPLICCNNCGTRLLPPTPDRAGRLSNLGIALQARFQQSGNLADLDEAITVGRRALAAAISGQPDRAMWLSNLGLALRSGSSGPGHWPT